MKKIIFTFLCSLVLFTSTNAIASPFCDGWEAGYIAGYCYKRANCSEPLVPVCPSPVAGKDTYQDGKELGFSAGLNAWRLLNAIPSKNLPQTTSVSYDLAGL